MGLQEPTPELRVLGFRVSSVRVMGLQEPTLN